MPERSKDARTGFIAGRFGEFPARWSQGLSDQLTRIARSPFGPSEEEVRANLAGEASADAALALHDAELEAGVAEPDSEVPRDLTAAAFFDVDNTMVQGASIVHFARGLAARKYFKSSDLVDIAWKQVKFRVTGKENAA